MPKSDDTRYASELPALFAWDPTYDNLEIQKAREIALHTRRHEYDSNTTKATKHQQIIVDNMNKQGYPEVESVTWQANNNRNDNGSPADIVFAKDHPIGGQSIKDGSDIVHNGGLNDFNTEVKKPRGVDLFEHLAPIEFKNLRNGRVVFDLLSNLDIGSTWTEPRKTDYGKYAITRIDENKFKLKFDNSYKIYTKQDLLTGTFVNKRRITKPLPGKWWRVFGDYYQEQLLGNRKNVYRIERDSLFKTLHPIIVDLCEKIIISDPEKLCKYLGFTEKPYYVSDLHNNKIYFVQSKSNVIDKIKLEIYDKEKDKTFGSGFELGCKVSIGDPSNFATLDFYVCYNSGTFKSGPVIKIQNFKDKEKLWQRIA
jgi:hypothetical protein